MAKVMIHATVSLDGFMADESGGMDWMSGFPVVPADEALVAGLIEELGAVVGGANRSQTIEEGETPYGGIAGVPVFLMTRSPREPIEKDGVTYSFVVDDVAEAVAAARQAAGEKWVSVLGGTIARQCLEQGLVDEIVLHVAPVVLGKGIPLLAGLSTPLTLERLDTSAFAGEVHLRYCVLA